MARSGKGSVILSMAAGLGTLGAAAAPVGGAGPAAPGAATASPGAAGRTGARLCRRVMSDWAKALAPKAQEFLGNAQFLVLLKKKCIHQSTRVYESFMLAVACLTPRLPVLRVA